MTKKSKLLVCNKFSSSDKLCSHTYGDWNMVMTPTVAHVETVDADPIS